MAKNIVGTPARGEDFFDREELVETLWERLDAGNVLLAAPRRFGKTSLMYRLLDQPRPGWKPLHIDAESIREPVLFIVAVLETLMADHHIRNFLLGQWRKAGAWFRSLLDEAEFTGPWDVGMRIRLKDKMAPHWQERGEALLHALRGYDGAGRLLLIIDELPVMLYLFRDNDVSDAEARAFLYWFRKLRTDPRVGLANCRFLIGGSIGIEHYLSSLRAADSFNDFERVSLGELAPDRARQFLRELLKARGLRLSAAAQKRILDHVGAPIPYFIQFFVAEIATARASEANAIGPTRLDAIYHDRVLGAACKTYFQHYYDRLCHYDKPQEHAAKALLKAMALAHPHPVRRADLHTLFVQTLVESATDDAFARLIGDLENDFYIRYSREADGYSFASKILCDWWRRYYAF
ncbi:MAG: ATP-binding protein [Planctomycetes bacterium]|nr:ATP-binding protein [Planctomycetota bacterium]